jgi:hypothetical protein
MLNLQRIRVFSKTVHQFFIFVSFCPYAGKTAVTGQMFVQAVLAATGNGSPC